MSDKCSFCQTEVKEKIWDGYVPFYRIRNQEIHQISFVCSSCWDKNKEKFSQKNVDVWYKKGDGNYSDDYYWKALQGKCDGCYLGENGCQGKNMAYGTYWTANTGMPSNHLTCIRCLKFRLKKDIAELEKNSPFTPEQEKIYNQKKQQLAELLRDNPNDDNEDDNGDDRRDENNPEKQELEHLIAMLQQGLKALKQIPKNHPGYNEYQKQQLEKQLAEAINKYKAKFGNLPSSLREDTRGGGWKPLPKWKELCAVDSSGGGFSDCGWNSCLFLVEEKGKEQQIALQQNKFK